MQGIVTEFGARFTVGVPHPGASAATFSAAILRHPELRRRLGGSRWRLISAQLFEEPDAEGERFIASAGEAVLYDYSRGRMLRVAGGPTGLGLIRIEESVEQPVPSPGEFREALDLVMGHPDWGPMVKQGLVKPYRPMPPVLDPGPGNEVERTLYVGLVSRPRKFNRMVAVNMITGQVSPEPVVPARSRVAMPLCGVTDNYCFPPPHGTPGTVRIQWPAKAPVWDFQATRPSASSGCNGSGIELKNVRYRGKTVLTHAHVPILNVKYENDDACGPYRDWLYEEVCFEAFGTDIAGAPGFRWCTQPARTLHESGVDGGNFQGVAVFEDTDGALVLVSQMAAGWYRYIPEFRFYPDGRILPQFKFGAVDNACVCINHTHHAYWRLRFRICTNKNVVEQAEGTGWTRLRRETAIIRQTGVETRWRVRQSNKLVGYEIIPGPNDGVGDEYSREDQYVLRSRAKEIDDGHCSVVFNTEADIARYVRRESVVNTPPTIWYAAHFRHSVEEDGDAHTVVIGPTLQPFGWT